MSRPLEGTRRAFLGGLGALSAGVGRRLAQADVTSPGGPLSPDEQAYIKEVDRTRPERIRWWREARFGMFVHWGLYSQLGRHEWVMNRERIPRVEYEALADSWKPRPRVMREWARLARQAGMKYVVMTTKHHDGFLLWDSKMTEYNAARRGPRRDLVAEYVQACRAEGLRVGFYYSLMDWHHPAAICSKQDEKRRRQFVDFSHGCVRELCTNYGPIDILWYDLAGPIDTSAAWESVKLGRMVRALQPQIVINNRARLPEDFGTPEGEIKAEASGRDWEACMTFNGGWGYFPAPAEDWLGVRKVLSMLREVTAKGGNLLLNIGPKADGSVPREAIDRLTRIGRWTARYGDVLYGAVGRVEEMDWMSSGAWTRKGTTLYHWCSYWPGTPTLAIAGLSEPVVSARLLPDGKPLRLEQTPTRVIISGLPKTCPDPVAQMPVLELKFAKVPTQKLRLTCDPAWPG